MIKRISIYLGLGLIVIIIILSIWINSIAKKVFFAKKENQSIKTQSLPDPNQLNLKSPFNVLLVGYGGKNHDGGYLTDSIMVIHIEPKTQKIFLISIPRDLWYRNKKINAAYTTGLKDGTGEGAKMAEKAVSEITGLPVKYFVGVDFTGFSKTIDTLGGVDINIEKTFDDYEYPLEGKEDDLCGKEEDFKKIEPFLNNPSASPGDKEQLFKDKPELEEFLKNATSEAALAFPCRYEKLHFDAGFQHLDGTTALKYVRSRHSLQDGTDFGRARRQQNLLVAFKDKVFSAGFIPKVIPFINSIGDNLRTDLTINNVGRLIQEASILNKYQITTLALTDDNYLINSFSEDKQSILIPKDGIDNWTGIQKWIKDTISPSPQPVKNDIK